METFNSNIWLSKNYASQEHDNMNKLYTFMENIKSRKDIRWFDKNYQFNQRPDEVSR